MRFVTDNGRDEAAYEGIFQSRYGVTTRIPDYSQLTSSTTSESASRFQKFHPEEIVQLINMFEEMPKGMHKLPELQYLVRRLDGTPHPLYPGAPAVAWPDYGYIEFMESGFSGFSVAYVHRLIIHEKAHFLWAHQFDGQLKQDWIELGGWYYDSESLSEWSTSKQTEFVSAYAHLKDPNEDMAESIAYFIVNPDKLKSRAIGKYEFVRDRIMQGNIYISTIREDLTFEVYNLYPRLRLSGQDPASGYCGRRGGGGRQNNPVWKLSYMLWMRNWKERNTPLCAFSARPAPWWTCTSAPWMRTATG